MFMIIIIHELGHIITIKVFRYKIDNITIYPFGGIIKISKLINSSTTHDILIAISGIVFQYIVINSMIYFIDFTDNTLNILINYNKTIILFNMLPIVPLDGSKLLNAILNKLFSYKRSFYITVIISIISIIFFINYNYIYSLNNYLIVMILIYYTYKYYSNFKYEFNKFLLERILYKLKYKNIDSNTKNISGLKKEILHYFKEDNKYINERKKIQDIFDKNTYF